MDTRQRSTKLVIALFAVSLFLRLIALMVLPPPDSDAGAIGAYRGAHRLVDGIGFSDPSYSAFIPPLHAIFISIFVSLFGDDQVPVKIVQAFMESTMIIIVYYIIREIFDARTGLLSAGILCIYPFSIYLTISIANEPLFTFLLSCFVLSIIFAIKSHKLQYYCAAGIVLGLATLTRGTTQFFPLMFIIMLLPFTRLSKDLLLACIAFGLSFALVILPWTLRNYIVLEDFIPVAANGGIVFLQGSSEKFFTIEGKTKEWPAYFEALRAKGIEPPPEWSKRKESEMDKFYFKAAIESYKSRLQNNPLSFVPFLANKFFRLWYATESGNNETVVLAVNLLIYPFTLAGLVLAWVKKKSLAWLLFCILLYFIVLHWVSLPLFRYMVPVMPYVIGFAAFAVTTIVERIRFPYGLGPHMQLNIEH